jgi:hypothetical protein
VNFCNEDYFPFIYFLKKFNIGPEEICHQVAFGNNDYGIDAYYFDRQARNLYLYQFKFSENHNLFKESLERLTKDGIERIFGNPLLDPKKNDLLTQLKFDLKMNKDCIERVIIQFVFKGDGDVAENSSGLRDRRENLEGKKWIINNFFGRDTIDLIINFVSDKPIPPPPSAPHAFSIEFAERVSIDPHPEMPKLHVGFVSLMDLYGIYRELNNKFFDRNIRSGLSPDNPPNRKIREALVAIVLKQTQHAASFGFNHNGVTLAVENIVFEDGHAQVKVPRLLNGAQTITSLAKFIEDNEGNPALDKNYNILKSIKVLAKIVVDDPQSDFVTNVTICNNRQNPVDPWNLRANDRIQNDLQDRFRERLGVYYSRQEKSFENYTESDLQEMGYDDTSRGIEIKRLAQTFLETWSKSAVI